MVRYNIITAFRNLIRYKGYSLINVLGLAVGMACSILILIWVQDELSYDDFHTNKDHIYRILSINELSDEDFIFSASPAPLARTLVERNPEIINATRFTSFFGKVMLSSEDKSFYEEGGRYVDPEFFEIFDFRFIEGDPRTALNDTLSIVLTEKMADKFFGVEDPLGKTIKLENIADLKVTGVVENAPENSHIQFDFLVPFILTARWKLDLNSWSRSVTDTYIQLQEGADSKTVAKHIADFKHEKEPENNIKLEIQPLEDIYLRSSKVDWDPNIIKGEISYVYIFSSVAFLILLIACINFINLTTARSINRLREIGLRKVVGASREQLVKQFIGESILLAFIGIILALAMAELLLPTFNGFTEKNLGIAYFSPEFILGLVGILLFTGLVSGIYPALVLSSYQPASALKGGSLVHGLQGGIFRKILVVVQFIFSIGLIIATLVMNRQLNFIQEKNVGIDRDNVIYIQNRPGMYEEYPKFKKKLLENPNVIAVTASNLLADTYLIPSDSVDWEGKDLDSNRVMEGLIVDYGYFETLNLEILEGRIFRTDSSDIERNSIIINQTAADLMGLRSPVGTKIARYSDQGEIVGLVKDFHIHSLKYKIPPLLIWSRCQYFLYILVRLDPDKMPQAIKYVEKTWRDFAPVFPFEYKFLNEEIENRYQTEKRMRSVFLYFATLAVFLSCLGLLGLATFLSSKRTKEIGVRKVLGADEIKIFGLLTKEFLRCVLAAYVAAVIISYFAMNEWLDIFAYHTGLHPLEFLIAGLITLGITFFTVSFQALKAAVSSPAKSLRYE